MLWIISSYYWYSLLIWENIKRHHWPESHSDVIHLTCVIKFAQEFYPSSPSTSTRFPSCTSSSLPLLLLFSIFIPTHHILSPVTLWGLGRKNLLSLKWIEHLGKWLTRNIISLWLCICSKVEWIYIYRTSIGILAFILASLSLLLSGP